MTLSPWNSCIASGRRERFVTYPASLSKQFFDDLAAIGNLHRSATATGEGGVQRNV